MRQIFFIIILVFGYKWLADNGYIDDLLGMIRDFNPDDFINFLQSLFAELTEMAQTIIDKIKK